MRSHTPDPSIASAIQALSGITFHPARTSLLYRGATLLVAVAMVLLPCAYLALISLLGCGLYWHAVEHIGWLAFPNRLVAWFVYGAPLIVGSVLLVFLIKPLLGRAPKPFNSYSITPASEPVLFAFITEICRLVHAPAPARIDLDCNVNASASLRRSFLSFAGQDLVLTVGLPLVSALNLRQFAGILAHEFGHFSQGAGMKMMYLIQAVNNWFARVVYERDLFDAALDASASNSRLELTMPVTKVGVWLARAFLWVLMKLGQLVSCLLLRQMEFEADSYEAKLAGSDAFVSTTYEFELLQAAAEQTYKWIMDNYPKEDLPQDFAAFVVQQLADLEPAEKSEVLNRIEKQTTGTFDTHPSSGDRIRAVQALAEPGLFHAELPAALLFQNFALVCKKVTRLHYVQDLGFESRERKFTSTQKSIAATS